MAEICSTTVFLGIGFGFLLGVLLSNKLCKRNIIFKKVFKFLLASDEPDGRRKSVEKKEVEEVR